MRHQWKLPHPAFPDFAPPFEPVEVLIEVDGPQLVTLDHQGAKWLALAVDDDADSKKGRAKMARWVIARMTHHEWEGLIQGGLSVRSVLSKDSVMIVDYSLQNLTGTALCDINSKDIPESAMPEPGAPLPDSVCAAFAKGRRIETPYFDIVSRLKYVPFGALSAVAGRLQGLWNAFAGHTPEERIVLGALALAPGSLRVNVHTDNPKLFTKIASQYRALVIASDDAQALNAVLSETPDDIAEAYREYLKVVDLQEVEVLAKWDGEAAFVAHPIARRTREQMRETSSNTITKTKEVLSLRGYFDNFWRASKDPSKKRQRAARFEFYGVDSDHVLQGGIDKTLRARTQSREFQLTIGRRSTLYSVKILIQRENGEITKTILQDFEIVAPPAKA